MHKKNRTESPIRSHVKIKYRVKGLIDIHINASRCVDNSWSASHTYIFIEINTDISWVVFLTTHIFCFLPSKQALSYLSTIDSKK
jgi:hypothetical protein